MRALFLIILMTIFPIGATVLAEVSCKEKCENWKEFYFEVCMIDYYHSQGIVPADITKTDYCKEHASLQVMLCEVKNCPVEQVPKDQALLPRRDETIEETLRRELE